VAYTDGLVESRTASVSDGIERLVAILGCAAPDRDVGALADELLAGSGRTADGGRPRGRRRAARRPGDAMTGGHPSPDSRPAEDYAP
jgi:hypothetical protein